jgi:hypothetical protein
MGFKWLVQFFDILRTGDLFARKRSKALMRYLFKFIGREEFKAPTPQISKPNLQENHLIEEC